MRFMGGRGEGEGEEFFSHDLQTSYQDSVFICIFKR